MLGLLIALGLIPLEFFIRPADRGSGLMHPQIRRLSKAGLGFNEGEPLHWTRFYAKSDSREVHYQWGQRDHQQS